MKFAGIIQWAFFAIILFAPANGQEFKVKNEDRSKYEAQSRKASHYYEVLIKDVLSKYYDERTFLVDANVFLNESEEIDLEGDLDDIYTLPGLPVLPNDMKEGAAKARAGKKQSDFSINHVEVEIMVDTSYEDKDYSFIKKLISMSANLNEYRGDRLDIRSGIFPVQKKPNSGYQLAENMDPKALPSSKADSELLEKEEKLNPFKPLVDNLASLIPLLIICIFVLLIAVIVSRAFSKNRQRSKVQDSYTNIINELQEIKTAPEKEKSTEANKEEDSGNNELREMRSYVLSAFIGDTASSSQVLKKWIQQKGEEGHQETTKLIKAVDERILKVVSTELGKEETKNIENRLKQLEPLAGEEVLAVYKQFKEDYQNQTSSIINESEYADLFGFLRQMNEQQILHLLKEESEGIIGMALAQVEPSKASSILQKLDKSKRTKILAGMGKIQNIPLKVYKELADRLSANALEVINMRYVASDGIESVLDVLDSLPISVQGEYLNSIAEVDLNLAEKIKNNFITLPEITSLPDKFLTNSVRNVNQDVLTNALAGVEEDIKLKVISLLPERMQLMIKSGLETKTDLKAEEIESAQKTLLQKIRQDIKAYGGRPEA